MNKRIMSFFLVMMLVVATVCQPIAATTLTAEEEQAIQAKKAAKAERMEASAENVKREMSTEMQDAAVTISENGYDLVEIDSETPYVVFKFVPQETKEYCFFSNRVSGDPYVDLYIGDVYYRDYDDEAGNSDFQGKMKMEAGTEYYFKLTDYWGEDAVSYYFIITSDYESKLDWLYGDKTVSSVSINDLPQHEFWDLESDAIDAYIYPGGVQAVTYFTDGTAYTEYIDDVSGCEYDDDERVVATYFDTIKNTYKMYWETLKEVDGKLYMDETVPNYLCIEDENGQVTKYPVVINETDISAVTLKTAPTVTQGKILVNNLYSYGGVPFRMDGLELTVTRGDGSTYDLKYELVYDEDDDENYYMFTCEEDVEILPYSFALERDEDGLILLGENTLTVTYGGQEVEIPTFLYNIQGYTVLNKVALKMEKYPFESSYDALTLKGLKIQTNFSDGTSNVTEVTEDVNEFYLDGNYAYAYEDEGKLYLYIEANGKSVEIGTCEIVNKSMSAYPGLGSISLDVPLNVTVPKDTDRVWFRYIPDVTTEYRIYSEPGDKPDGDPRVDVYTDTDTEEIATGDDDNDMQFDLKLNMEAGKAYYFAFKSYDKPETFRVTLESTKQLQQTITAPASITKKMSDAPFAIGAKALGNAKMTYASSNPAVATIAANGMVTVKSAGTTTITINAAQTKSFTAATKKVTLTVNKIPVPINVADTITKAKGSKKFSLNASSVGKMTYSTSNKKVATVDANGKVTIKNCGKAVITIKATADGYLNGEKQVVIKVVPKKTKIKSVKSTKAGQITVKWERRKEAKGYIIEYSTDKNFKSNVKSVKVNKNKTTSKTIKKLKKGKKYYVRVKAYVTIDKKAEAGAVSAKKKVKIKK